MRAACPASTEQAVICRVPKNSIPLNGSFPPDMSPDAKYGGGVTLAKHLDVTVQIAPKSKSGLKSRRSSAGTGTEHRERDYMLKTERILYESSNAVTWFFERSPPMRTER